MKQFADMFNILSVSVIRGLDHCILLRMPEPSMDCLTSLYPQLLDGLTPCGMYEESDSGKNWYSCISYGLGTGGLNEDLRDPIASELWRFLKHRADNGQPELLSSKPVY